MERNEIGRDHTKTKRKFQQKTKKKEKQRHNKKIRDCLEKKHEKSEN